MAFTTSDLLSAIQRRTFAPANQLTYSDTELLALADEVYQSFLVPDIVAVREEFFVRSKDYDITANQTAYNVPARAAGMILREVWYVNGTTITPNFRRKEPEELGSSAPGTPDGFWLKYNQVMLDPPPAATTATLRLFFFLTPAQHVATSSAAVIASINTATNTVTVSSIPNAWATGNSFDLLRQDGGQEQLDIDLTSTLVTGSSITLPSLPDGLRVGDYVSLAGQTPLVVLPAEYRAVLAQGVAAEVLEAMNQPGAEKARATFDKMRQTSQRLITPRVQGEDRLITPVNWF